MQVIVCWDGANKVLSQHSLTAHEDLGGKALCDVSTQPDFLLYLTFVLGHYCSCL